MNHLLVLIRYYKFKCSFYTYLWLSINANVLLKKKNPTEETLELFIEFFNRVIKYNKCIILPIPITITAITVSNIHR